ALSQNAADTVFLLDAGGRYLFASPSCVTGTGLRPDDLYGATLFDRIHPDDLTEARRRFKDSLERAGETITGEYRNRHADDSWRVCEVRASTQLAHPDVEGIVVNARDSTARRQAEQKQHALEAERAELLDRFRLILDNMPIGCILNDPDFRFTYWNPAAD